MCPMYVNVRFPHAGSTDQRFSIPNVQKEVSNEVKVHDARLPKHPSGEETLPAKSFPGQRFQCKGSL